MKILLTIILSLTLTAPAWADYDGLATFDLSSLTFTGVELTITPQTQQQSANLSNINLLNPQTPDEPATNFASVPNPIFAHDEFAPVASWENHTVDLTRQDIGTAQSLFTPTVLGSTVLTHTADVGTMQSTTELNGWITPQTSGLLTVSVQYHIHHFGTPDTSGNLPDFFAVGHTQLMLNNNAVHGALFAVTGDTSTTGTLTLSQQVVAGVLSTFDLYSELNVNQPRNLIAQSVPVPGMFWPTASMLLGIGLLAWKRAKDVR